MAEIIQQQDTRREFIDALIGLAQKDERIVLVIPDVGFNYIEEFQKKFPDRFFNLGVTEQSAMTIAAGMALEGLRPYIYSMINFVAFRPFEAVRNAVCLHGANVKIIGVKGSEKYKFLGFSHNLIVEDEEFRIFSHLPGFKTYLAQKPEEVKNIILESYRGNNPCYIRL
jgi:transketolase